MPKTIISILGTSGRDYKSKEPSLVHYDCSILSKECGEYHNATDVLLEHFDGVFYFIGTQYAIDFQKELLDFRGRECHFVVVSDDGLDDVFEKVLELLAEHDDVLLDVTHGFRHQPIMAIFASTLSQFLARNSLQIVYAKVLDSTHYAYIYLDNYVEISQISLLLTGFIRTLNFIPVNSMKLLDNKVFENFSKSLLANDLRGVQKHHVLLQKELTQLENNEALSHIGKLLDKVQKELKPLEGFSGLDKHERYVTLAKMTVEKNYLVVALAYVFESLRTYSDLCFEDVCRDIEYEDDFSRKQDIMNAITNADRQFKKNITIIYKKHKGFYGKNKTNLDRVARVYLDIRKLRNSLAHINEHKEFADIKKMLFGYIFKVESIYRDDVLGQLKV
ncbi:MAG: Unknown protein [uncultured Sulfurovum sp.]|uniref:CRISPR-associated protein, TM1812 family n=1 Tax=uncultured Sulfurovum sp. TaxID=269237 RepID=A0A6S6RZ47_9BACT|nr:MAG: Unknown protein [uncultured Sulfurovum sp.]